MLKEHMSGREGSALVELVFAVLLICVMLTFIFGQYHKAQERLYANQVKQTLVTAAAKLNSSFAGQLYDFTDITSDTLVSLGVFPRSWLKGDAIISPFGGEITVAAANAGRNFAITVTDLPSGACIDLAQSGSAWVSVKINDKAAHTKADNDLPVSLVKAAQDCVGVDDDGNAENNTIVFTGR